MNILSHEVCGIYVQFALNIYFQHQCWLPILHVDILICTYNVTAIFVKSYRHTT